MGSVFLLTVRQTTGRLRLVIMGVLASLPVFFAIMVVRSSRAPSVEEFEQVALGGMLAGSILPLVVLAVAIVVFGNELEDRTLANLTLSPLPRWKIVLPKWLAAVVVSGSFMVLSAGITGHVAFNADWRATFAVTASTVTGVLLYTSLFVWLGLKSSKAIGFGLAYVIVWEGFFAGFVSSIRFLSIRHYAIALMHGLDLRRFATDAHVGLGATIAVSLAVVGGFLFLSVRQLRRMDIP